MLAMKILMKWTKTMFKIAQTELEENFVLCCGCEKKEISNLLQPCGHVVSESYFRRRCCNCCGVFIVDYGKFPQLQLYYVTFVLLSCSTFLIEILFHNFVRFCVVFCFTTFMFQVSN